MKRLMLGAVVTLVTVGLMGCGGSKLPDGEDKVEDLVTSMAFNLVADPNFCGNSVRIKGDRGRDADLKYPCLSHFNECFEFDSNGELKVPAEIKNLCPTTNLPSALWTFQYRVFSGPGCTGDVLNAAGNPNNFICYDIDDIYSQKRPNTSVEGLLPGCNQNDVVCITENASKVFDFDVCVEKTPPCTDENGVAILCPPTEPLILDCGCVIKREYETLDPLCADMSIADSGCPPRVCECPQGLDGLPRDCTVLPENRCNVVCGGNFNGVP